VFDWIDFLQNNHIPYATSGANVSSGTAVISCPLCGHEDEGKHMVVSLRGRGWKCWRRPSEHRGREPARLISLLLRISLEQARLQVYGTANLPGDLLSSVQALVNPPSLDAPPKTKLELLPEFVPLTASKVAARAFQNYMLGRGFYLDELERFDLYYCTSGPFRARVIFPIHFNGRLVCWTGRSIKADEELRYRTLSADPEKAAKSGLPLALGQLSNYLMWYDDLIKTRANTLVLVEGPMDALKVDILGVDYGICSTCFFTAQPGPRQIDLLHTLAPRFERRYLLLDRGTLPTALRVTRDLQAIDISIRQVPEGTKDPGALQSGKMLLSCLSD
jgi:hypothetical protein